MNVRNIQNQIEKLYLEKFYIERLHLERLREIPEIIKKEDRYRRTFYVLPLFVQWILGITWEQKQDVCKSAERGMALFLIFGTGTVGTFVLTGMISSLVPSLEWLTNLLGLVLQSVTGLFYLVASIYFSIQEYKGKEIEAAYLDRIYNWISAYTSA